MESVEINKDHAEENQATATNSGLAIARSRPLSLELAETHGQAENKKSFIGYRGDSTCALIRGHRPRAAGSGPTRSGASCVIG